MAWSDEPTKGQLDAIYNLIQWHTSVNTAASALQWLTDTATRQEVSYELKRLRELSINHKLTEAECFNSKIWEGFDYV